MSLLARLLALLAALAPQPAPVARAPGPPRLTTPRSYEVFDGLVAGVAPPGRRRLVARFAGRRFAVPVAPDGRFHARLRGLRWGRGELRVGPFRAAPVYALPPRSLRPLVAPRLDPALAAAIARAAAATTPCSGIYVRAAGGPAAAWNAGARFEAASTLKLAVMLVALGQNRGELRSSPYWAPMLAVTRWSDNAAADRLLVLTGGDEAGGAARMVALVRSLGLDATRMSGGYLLSAGSAAPPVTVVEQPPAAGKETTAADMAALAALVADAAAGRGRLLRHGVSRHEARELLFLLLGAEDPGLVSAAAAPRPVAHKIGWLDDVRDDVAIVFTRRGPLVVSIFTYGSIDASVERLGARVSRAALRAAAARPRRRAGPPRPAWPAAAAARAGAAAFRHA